MRSVKEKIKIDGSNQVLMCLAVKKLPGEPAYIVRQGKFFRYGSSRSAYLLCHPRSILCSCSVFLRILRLIVAAALHKIPGKKLSTAKLKPLRYLKYVILVVFVILLPAFVTNSLGMGDPFFCKYICPQGVLEGAIPLALANSGIRAALGHLFTFKFTILALFIILSILFYRPFCKWICPLGAIYSLFNKVSFLKIQVDHEKCVGCQKCSRVCKMDVNVVDTPNHPECIRCGECMKACPTDAICYHYGFSTKKQAENKN